MYRMLGLLVPFLLLTSAAYAEVHEVKMLNRNGTGGMVYEPDFLRLRPGDRVRFLATHVTHNAASMPELLPEGARPFKGGINEEIEVTFTEPGLYGIKCIPHYAMGMVMLVQVGEGAVEIPAALPVSIPARVRQRFTDILNRVAQTSDTAD